MKKFDDSQWVDYVRGVAGEDLEQTIRRELASGAGSAAGEERLWRRVAAVGHRDVEAPVPEYAVRIAKAVDGLRRPGTAEPDGPARGFRRLPFEIVFDSLQGAPAGVRSSAPEARHLVFESGDFTVDVRLEPEAPGAAGEAAKGNVLAGQILRGDAEPLPQAPILIFAGDDVVGSSLTSAAGEFRAEGLPESTLNLCLMVGGDACIEVELDRSPP